MGVGKDYTLFATQEGIVSFHQTKYKREVRVATRIQNIRGGWLQCYEAHCMRFIALLCTAT